MTDNVIHGYFKKLSDEAAPHTRPTTELGGKPFGPLRLIPNFVRYPSHGHIERLFLECPELRGFDDDDGCVYLWLASEADFATAAAALGVAYDPATDHETGKAFSIDSVDGWFNRKDTPAREKGIRLGQLKLRLKRRKRERGELLARGKMRPGRLP